MLDSVDLVQIRTLFFGANGRVSLQVHRPQQGERCHDLHPVLRQPDQLHGQVRRRRNDGQHQERPRLPQTVRHQTRASPGGWDDRPTRSQAFIQSLEVKK